MTIPEAIASAASSLDAGKLRDAERTCRALLLAAPDHPEALHLLAVIAHRLAKHRLAAELAARAIAVAPGNALYFNTLGMAFRGMGDLDRASAALQTALRMNPALAVASINLGNVLSDAGDYAGAERSFRAALQVEPGHAGGYLSLGNALKDQGKLDEAIAAWRRAIECRSNYPEAFSNLATLLKDQGMIEPALDYYRRAVTQWPENAALQSNLIYALLFLPHEEPDAWAQETALWNERHARGARPWRQPHASRHDPARRLKIGYVSPDFRDHVVGRNLLPLLRLHDTAAFETYCYSGTVHADAITAEFRNLSNHWRDVAALGDAPLAETIRADGVDILVDLTLHLAGNRLPVFARKPAPVQVSFAGYPGSTGLETMDYRLTDGYLEPIKCGVRSAERGVGEQPIPLAHSFWCYAPDGTEPEVNGLPATGNGYVVFGCLNNFCKVNEPMLTLWARVMEQVAGSRLVILTKEGSHRQRTRDRLAKEGVSPGRVRFVGLRPRREYLALYHRLDLALDTFPYNGHTTSLDALWMGVPVVSRCGVTPVSRAGLSQLSHLELPELVAHSEEDYVRLAVALARDTGRLAGLRATLRERMRASPLTDAAGWTRSIEDAYRQMWQRWCEEKSVED